MQGSLFVNYEQLLLKVARVVLVLLATCSFIVVVGVLVWLTFSWIKPIGESYKDSMLVPVYESIGSAWSSTPSEEQTSESADSKLPPVFDDILETVDSLYQLVGREEPKFSEKKDVKKFYAILVEPFHSFDQRESFAIDFLIELRSYTQSMAKDELLKRIADVEVRTTTIEDSIFQFQDDYLENLRRALDTVAEQSTTLSWNRMVTSTLALQVLSVCLTAFVVATMCLLGFHVVAQRQGNSMTKTTLGVPIEEN